MIIARKITELREAKGWSQPELARRLGVSQNTIHKLEAGKTGSSRHLLKLAHVLSCAPEDIDDGRVPGERMTNAISRPTYDDDDITVIYGDIRDDLKQAAREALKAIRDYQPK